MKLVITLLLVLFLPSFVAARPVSYPGGWTFITENDAEQNSALMHYTITPRVAVGYRASYNRDTHATFNGIQMNNLLKRWNNPDSQANIYTRTAIGLTQDKVEGFGGIQADWETRRYMISYENMAMFSPDDRRNRFHQMAGVGIAPYVAEFGSFHTWAMLHVIHAPEDRQEMQWQPMMRFFKGPLLFEGGYNTTLKYPVVDFTARF